MCDCADQLPDWAAGRLAPAARARVDDHLAACAACRTEAEGWRAAGALVRARVDGRTGALALPLWRDPEARCAAVSAMPARSGNAAGRIPADDAPLAARTVPPHPWRAALARRGGPALALSALAVAAAAALFIVRSDATHRSVVGGPAGRDALSRSAPGIDLDADIERAEDVDPAAPTVVVRAPTPVRRLGGAAPRTAAGLATGAGTGPGRLIGAGQTSTSHAGLVAALPTATPIAPDLQRGGPPEARDRDAPHVVTSPPLSSPIPPPTAAPPVVPPSTAPPPPPPAPPSPTPVPPAALVAGAVTGPDGLARAEVRIVAVPLDPSVAPVEGGTDAAGAYTLTLQPGRWSIRAEAGAYLLAWPDDHAAPLDSPPVEAVAGMVQRADFAMRTAPGGAIQGRVVDRAGEPVAGALVVAARPDREHGGYDRFVSAGFTDAAGAYALPVRSGGWLVAATADWRTPDLVWWGGGDLITVDRVSGDRDGSAAGIDIRLRE